MKKIELQPDEYLGEDGLPYCKNCHTPRAFYMHEFDCFAPTSCKCRRDAYEKAEYERKLQERKAKTEEYRRNSALGKHFRNCTFETAKIIPSNKAVYQMCRNYCAHADKMYDAGVGAYLYGVPGVGKTHLTACMGNALADKLYTVLFTSFVEIERKLKEGFGNNSAQSAVLNKAETVDFLFLDDIGAENVKAGTGWLQTIAFDLINTRINAKKPTIYSSNYRISALMANCNYEERTAHRIKGSCLFERQLDCENMRDLVRKRNEKKLLKFINGDI